MLSVLEIDSVTKYYGYRDILTDIYLKCETGDILGLLGRNGTGKTTLLKILFGTLAAEHKFIRIDGKIRKQAYKTIDEMCYLPQESFLPQHFILTELPGLYAVQLSVEEFFGDPVLKEHAKNRVSSLSAGLLRYLEIKLLLSTKAKFVIMDEPFNGISPILVESIKSLIRGAASTKGIILTDHDYSNILDVSNRCCLLYDGGLKQIKDKNDLVQWGYISASRL